MVVHSPAEADFNVITHLVRHEVKFRFGDMGRARGIEHGWAEAEGVLEEVAEAVSVGVAPGELGAPLELRKAHDPREIGLLRCCRDQLRDEEEV